MKKVNTPLFVLIVVLVTLFFVLVSCEKKPEPIIRRTDPTEQVQKPKRVSTPEAMLDQCRAQSDIPYCQKRCEDTKSWVIQPDWCK